MCVYPMPYGITHLWIQACLVLHVLSVTTSLMMTATQEIAPVATAGKGNGNREGGITTDDDEWNSVPSKDNRRRNRPRHPVQDENVWSSTPPLPIEYLPPSGVSNNSRPYMLLLAGLPGSGKSTFARSLVEAMPYKVCHWRNGAIVSPLVCITYRIFLLSCSIDTLLIISLNESIKMK